MDMFENIKEKLIAQFSDWIQVVDPKSSWDLDNAQIIKDVGVDPKQVNPHCVKCVVVNHCWFKNENGKKPEPFGYDKYSTIALAKMKDIVGLYHPHCHCKEISIPTPTNLTVKVEIDDKKINDAYKRKFGLLEAWGYTTNDKQLLKNFLTKSAKENYIEGNYRVFKYDKFGFQISLQVSVPGLGIKSGKNYNFITGFQIFPNGRIWNTTFFGGKLK